MSALLSPASPEETVAVASALLAELRSLLAAPSVDAGRQFAEAFSKLQGVPPDSASVPVVECLLAITQHYFMAAQPALALPPAFRAVEVARNVADTRLLRKALSFLGVIRMETANLPGATESYSEALSIARELNDPGAEAPVWNNLGLALQNGAQYSDALQCFERAVALAARSDQFASVESLALTNIAGCALHLHDVRSGIKAVRRAIELNPNPQTASGCFARVNAESNYSRLLLDIGEVGNAAEHCEIARSFAAKSPTARAEYMASMTSGLVDVHSRNIDIGLTRLKRALEQARQNVRSEVRDALSACVAGYETAGQPDVALVYLHELLALNKEARGAQVLMHHREHTTRLDQAIQTGETIETTLATHQGKLRGQLGERELTRNRMLLLEQQSIAAELHDDTTGEHCYRVGRLASILGKEIGLEEDVCFLIDLAARLHDIGKLVVPDAILLKPGKLTAGEFEIMQTHTTAGADILAKSNVPQMHIAEEIARHHHEKWDGTGYPMKLAGTAIPIAARVTALADVFDALTHVRPYKKAWTVRESLDEIAACRGKHFDPELTDVFLELVPRLQREHGDLDEFLAVEAKTSPFIQARKQIAAALKGSDPATSLFDTRR
ncbi:MAG: HD domain-containing protein [Burkholderiaceae bacterium]|nr:HD domain-containing protein [Burkholderiaceae bacterium]